MEHACGQCGATVEDGQPFCRHCHAPQIKVPVRPPTAPVTEAFAPGTPEDAQPPAEPVTNESFPRRDDFRQDDFPQNDIGGPPQPPRRPPEGKLLWRPALGSALLAGMLAAVGTSIPVIPLAMLCMFASGGLAVTLYRRRAGYPRVLPSMGAKLGILAGGLGFGVLSLLSALRLFASSERSELRIAFRDKMQEAMASASDPQVRQAMDELRNYISTDRGLVVMVLFFLAIAALLFLVFAALGGALGAVLFGRDGERKES